MDPGGDTSHTPGEDLRQALAGGCSLIGRQLTRGEFQVVDDWMGLSADARALYGRLFVRRDRLVRESDLRQRYAEVRSPSEALDALEEAGFVWRSPRHPLPISWLVALYDRPELASICRDAGLPHTGRRDALASRLAHAGEAARPKLERPGVRLRHRGLFRRLCRVYLGRSDGDLSALVLHRMGTVRVATYTPTGGSGPFPDRRTLLRYEAARRWSAAVAHDGEVSAQHRQQALDLIAHAPPAAPEVRRFRALRYAVRVAMAAAEALERQDQHAEAAPIWARLASTDHRDAMYALRRFALCAERTGDVRDAIHALNQARPHATPTDRLALERTGRRLARKGRLPWRPSPPLAQPPKRTLTLPITPEAGRRPLWNGEVVELAVARVLTTVGRTVFPSENLLWTTLFGVLLRDVLFAPVAGMLPGALQVAPLDYGLPAFARRREDRLRVALAEIRSDDGQARLAATFQDHRGEAIRGVAWDRWSLAALQEILTGLGGHLIASILAAIASGASRSGLPDLVVLNGPACRIPGLFPGRLPSGPLFVEVKGPGDTLRDGQHVWLDRLSVAGVTAEVWDIRGQS